MSQRRLIGIDWGTSSFRAWLMTANGDVLDSAKSDSGILAVRDGNFDQIFEAAVGPWQARMI